MCDGLSMKIHHPLGTTKDCCPTMGISMYSAFLNLGCFSRFGSSIWMGLVCLSLRMCVLG